MNCANSSFFSEIVLNNTRILNGEIISLSSNLHIISSVTLRIAALWTYVFLLLTVPTGLAGCRKNVCEAMRPSPSACWAEMRGQECKKLRTVKVALAANVE